MTSDERADVVASSTPVVMDGHVHITSRVYWEGIDPWKPQTTGWDYARARAAGINCVIECLGTYGYWNYNQAPKHTLRLIETFHRVAEVNEDKMGIALSAGDARRIIASGRMAVFLGVESGWDHDGDIDVLRALYRLGLRSIQLSSQTPFNALADVARYRASFAAWSDDPEADALVPTADEWATQVAHVIETVGADHVGIGLDMFGSRNGVPRDPAGYPDLFAAINRITTPENARKIIGENWLRVIEKVMG